MKAIVLTYDRYRPIADHMMYRYRELWPDHPFRFRIPFQTLAPSLDEDGSVEYRKTPPDIKGTVLALLSDLDDDEFVYWSIDDKYPVKLDVPRIRRVYDWLNGEDPPEVSGVLCSRFGNLWNGSYLTGRRLRSPSAEVLLEMRGYGHIWVHQFVRMKVLRALFEGFPDRIPNAKAMDGLLAEARLPRGCHLFVTRTNLAIYGESTRRGVLTANCHESMLASGMTLPEWSGEPTKRIVKGEMPANLVEMARFRLKRSSLMKALRAIRLAR